ncbi:unnamed protein product, partial [Durusdinium trenchii]
AVVCSGETPPIAIGIPVPSFGPVTAMVGMSMIFLVVAQLLRLQHRTKEGERSLEFCGCQLARTATESVTTQTDYLKGIKPMTCADNDLERDLTSREQSSLRALFGALQWPATQTLPHLCASVLLLCGEVTTSTAGVAQQANKTLRFAKNNDAGLIFRSPGGSLDNLCMVAMSDAAWGVRRNGEGRGGCLVLFATRPGHLRPRLSHLLLEELQTSISRSSLNAESQACSAAMDALEYLLIFWEGCLKHDFQLRQVNELKLSLSSALVVDAKALYDSLKATKKKTLAERQANARKRAISRSGNRRSLAYTILCEDFSPASRLQQDLRDSDAYNAELKDKLDALEGDDNELEKEVDDLILMRDSLSGDIGELDGKYKDVRMKWQVAHEKLEAIKFELDRRPIARTIYTTRTGGKYHIYPDCQGPSGADPGSMK